MSSNQNIRIIELKDKINTICQISKYSYPIHINLPMQRQKIPAVLIGQVQFIAQNWLCDEKTRAIKLCEHILKKLECKAFVEEHNEMLSSFPVEFAKAFADDDEDIIVQTL